MRHTILTDLFFSQSGAAPITLIWLVAAVVVIVGRATRWARYLWAPLFSLAVLLTLPVLSMILVGGYALGGIGVWGFFPLIAIGLLVGRPDGIWSDRRGLVGLIVATAGFAVLLFVPRPNAGLIRLRFIEGNNTPIRNAAFPLSVYQGTGGNHEGILQTDSDGTTTLRVYGFECGAIALRDAQDPRRDKQIHFAPAGPIVDHRPTRYSFDGDEIAVNSSQVLTLFWPAKRDLSKKQTEPMLVFRPTTYLARDPASVFLDVERGSFGDDGDVEFVFSTGPDVRGVGPSFRVEVNAVGAASIRTSEEQFMDVAPDSGYRTKLEFERSATDPNYSFRLVFKFYVRTRSGKYGVVGAEVDCYTGSRPEKGFICADVRLNPSGSRNVEFDHTKWLNRN